MKIYREGKLFLMEFDPVINKNKALEISDRYKTTIDQSCLFIEVGGRIKKLIENDLLDDKGTYIHWRGLNNFSNVGSNGK